MTKPLDQAISALEEQEQARRASIEGREPSMSEKKERRDKFFEKLAIGRRLKKLFVLAAAIALLALVVWSYKTTVTIQQNGGLLSKLVVDTRPCSIAVPGTETVLTGSRSYSYRYREFNGWRWYDSSTVEEETRIDINGSGLTIIGSNANDPASETWVKNIDLGERYSQLLVNKQRYTILYGEKRIALTIDYRDMCK